MLCSVAPFVWNKTSDISYTEISKRFIIDWVAAFWQCWRFVSYRKSCQPVHVNRTGTLREKLKNWAIKIHSDLTIFLFSIYDDQYQQRFQPYLLIHLIASNKMVDVPISKGSNQDIFIKMTTHATIRKCRWDINTPKMQRNQDTRTFVLSELLNKIIIACETKILSKAAR